LLKESTGFKEVQVLLPAKSRNSWAQRRKPSLGGAVEIARQPAPKICNCGFTFLKVFGGNHK
jgi:hypothetical protein